MQKHQSTKLVFCLKETKLLKERRCSNDAKKLCDESVGFNPTVSTLKYGISNNRLCQ